MESNGEGLTGTSTKSAAARQASVVSERNPGVSIMTGPAPPERCAVLPMPLVASSITGTPPSAFSRAASRAIERCGSASMMGTAAGELPIDREAARKRALAAAALHRRDGDDRSRHLQYPLGRTGLGNATI